MKIVNLLKLKVTFQLTLATLLLTVLFSFFAFLSPQLANAQEACEYDENASDEEVFNQFNKCAIKQKEYDLTIFGTSQTFVLVDSLNNMILGYSTLHPETNAVTAGHGALATTNRYVASMFTNPPVSGVQYFASQIEKFNPIQPAYAQNAGIGYTALQPVQKLWTIFRNASYVGFIIVFLIIGFMVMFRAHISPQAVATVQDSIPRIIIALALVTFSYAIAGLMIDMMFVIINIIINLLGQSDIINAERANDVIFDHGIMYLMLHSWDNLVGPAAGAISDILKPALGGGGAISKLFSWTIGGIGGLIVGIAALIIMFRIFVMLLMAYVMIILMTLAAPFYFLVQALPGNNGATAWFKQMGANVAVFPVVSLMIVLAGAMAGIGQFGGTGAGNLQNIGDEALKFPLLVGGLPADAIGKIIGLGILFMTPSAGEMVKSAIGVKGGPQMGGAAASLGAGAGIASYPVRAAVSRFNEQRKNAAFAEALSGKKEVNKQPGEE